MFCQLEGSGCDGFYCVKIKRVLFFFQRFNATELLRLYINYDLLLEAAVLAVEYIAAVLGNGKEYFGLKVSKTLIYSRKAWGAPG